MKYGQTTTINVEAPVVIGGATSNHQVYQKRENEIGMASAGSAGYAMFNKNKYQQTLNIDTTTGDTSTDSSSSNLRRRSGNTVTAPTSGFGGAVQLTQKAAVRNDHMLRQSQKVEQSVAQMGALFSQMATLVMQQSETVMRIEDDVESGLYETQEAQKSMESLYEITKGNRSLIIKIFLLMMFFAVVFLVWT